MIREVFGHGRAEAAREHILLDRDEEPFRPSHLIDPLCIERLDEAHVDDGRLDALLFEDGGCFLCLLNHRADGQEGDIALLLQHFGLADGQGLKRVRERHAEAGAARVAHGSGPLYRDSCREHMAKLLLVLWRHDAHVGHLAQVREVEDAVMRRAVLADEAGAVEAERHGQVLQADIVDELVVGALRERRVERDDGVHARGRHASGQRHRVLLGDADVEEALRVRLAEGLEARARRHGRRDGEDVGAVLRELDERLAEDRGVGGRTARLLRRLTRARVEAANAVELIGRLLGRLVSLALDGVDMDEHGALHLLGARQHFL